MITSINRRSVLAATLAALLPACGGGDEPATTAQPQARRVKRPPPSTALTPQQTAIRMADFLVSLQLAEGPIKDDPGGALVNEDSNMEYALIGLAAAYNYTGNAKYLDALAKGVDWLGSRMTMGDAFWAGSYPLSFSATAPYAGDYSTRGVDATSGLFVYCVYLHQRLSGTTTLRDKYEPQIRAALGFLDAHNTGRDGFSLSSWVNGTMWAYEYAADQIDVYLGWEAAARMFPAQTHFAQRAAFYRGNVQQSFFLAQQGRYSIGRDEGSALETIFDGFDGIFPNGYLPWALGASDLNAKALSWLESCTQADGSMKVGSQSRAYALTVGIYLCGCVATGRTPQQSSIDWLCNVMFDPQSGGVADSTADNTKYSNVAGFCVVGLLGFQAFA